MRGEDCATARAASIGELFPSNIDVLVGLGSFVRWAVLQLPRSRAFAARRRRCCVPLLFHPIAATISLNDHGDLSR